MSQVLHGVVQGRTIELAENPGVPDGEQVEVVITVVQANKPWGDGIRRSEGGWADYPEMDEIMERIERERKIERPPEVTQEDRSDLFELVEALSGAETGEDYDAAARGMREILKQQSSSMRRVEPVDADPELQKWMDWVGGRIRHCREEAGMTQEELAKKAGLPQNHISRLERGHHSPSSLTLEKLAAALEIDISKLDPSR